MKQLHFISPDIVINVVQSFPPRELIFLHPTCPWTWYDYILWNSMYTYLPLPAVSQLPWCLTSDIGDPVRLNYITRCVTTSSPYDNKRMRLLGLCSHKADLLLRNHQKTAWCEQSCIALNFINVIMYKSDIVLHQANECHMGDNCCSFLWVVILCNISKCLC